MSLATVTKISAEWLGEVPTDWQVVGFRSVFVERAEKSVATDVHLTPSQKYGVLPQTEYMAITGSRVVLNLTGADNMKRVQPGDFVSHLRSFQGGLEISDLEGKVSAAYTVITPTRKCSPDYFRHLFKSNAFIQALQSTTDQLRDGQSIRLGELALIDIPFPPVKKQALIATYLDRETSEIDAFIAESERLIALLNERRTAAITQAVTKGLNPNAPMKDSGIEWLGQVPEHWDIQRISWLFDSTASGTTPSQDDLINPSETTVPWVVSGELREKSLFGSKLAVSEDTIKKYSALAVHPCGSLLIAMYGATIGRMAILGVDATSNQAICALVGAKGFVDIAFVQFALLAGRERLILDAAGGGQPNINQDKIRAFRIPLPPLNEQVEIHDFLEDKTSEIDAAIGAAREGIALARERRQALISAAVTGKIDVRSAL